MAEHLLHAAEVGAILQEMSRERMPEQMGMDALGLEAGFRGEPAEDQERAGARESAALRVQEQLRPVAAVEMRPASREVPP